MPGIFITRGSSLRIPAGGLVLPLDDRPPSPVQVELLLDMWDRWLAILSNEVRAAEAAHERLLRASARPILNEALLWRVSSTRPCLRSRRARLRLMPFTHPSRSGFRRTRTPTHGRTTGQLGTSRLWKFSRARSSLSKSTQRKSRASSERSSLCAVRPSTLPASSRLRATTRISTLASNGGLFSSPPRTPEPRR